jgi:phosphatidylinositol glycan class Q protein
MGLTMTLALLSDMVSFFTIHIFYFYTVSARFYAIMLHVLSSLWKLFRGTTPVVALLSRRAPTHVLTRT